MNVLKEKWKFSKWRFYYKNFISNFQFYLFSKKIFKDVEYIKGNEIFKPERVKKRRFIGYEFKGKTYLDNPGFFNVDREVWQLWKRKGYF